jgi:AcrR family transcriptional regulator
MGTRIDGRTLRYQGRREDLLEAVGDYVLDNGVATLSLRKIAEAVGVSHVTLQHHFGTKEQLVGEIVEHLLERTFTPAGDYDEYEGESSLEALWARWTSQDGQRDIRLFIEVLGQSLYEGDEYGDAVRRSMAHRLELVVSRLIGKGCPPEEALTRATLTLALMRGLMIDMLVTGERERVDRAFDLVIASTAVRTAMWQGS